MTTIMHIKDNCRTRQFLVHSALFLNLRTTDLLISRASDFQIPGPVHTPPPIIASCILSYKHLLSSREFSPGFARGICAAFFCYSGLHCLPSLSFLHELRKCWRCLRPSSRHRFQSRELLWRATELRSRMWSSR